MHLTLVLLHRAAVALLCVSNNKEVGGADTGIRGGGGGGGAHPFLSAVLPNQYLGHLDKACKALCTHSYPNMPLKGTHKHTHTHTHTAMHAVHTPKYSAFLFCPSLEHEGLLVTFGLISY